MELSSLRWLDTLGGLLLLLALPGLVQSNCVFGPNNTDHLILRNNTILSFMNATLMNFTQSANQAIARVSNFNLVSYLSYNYSLTAENYLEFVSLGQMLTIDWAAATKNAMTNESSTSRTVASFITTVFVTPLHDELQEMASYYSFSYRIFRPAQKQFYFTGFTPATSSGENSTLDLSCTAGCSFLLRLSTYITYNASFSNKRSPQFAKIATATEQAFDQYYRQNAASNKGYIRSNVITGFENSVDTLVLLMEIYFLNPTLQSADIFNLTILSRLPKIYYNDPLNAASATVVTFRPDFTYVINASYAPSTTTRSTMSTTTWTTNSPTTITPSFGLNSNPTTLATPTTNTAFSQFPSQSPAIQSSWASTNVNINNSTLTPVANSSQEVTTLTSSLTSNSTISASISVQTTLLSQITSTTPTISLLISSPIISESFSNPITATIASSTFATGTGSSIGTASSIPVTSTLTGNQLSSTGTPNSANSANLTQTNNLVTNGTIPVSNVTLPLSSFPVTGNISTLTTLPISQNQSTGTQPAVTTSPRNINGGTTFDPDSFFQAQVPVITKVYNDNFLLRKMGTMSPLTEKAAFFAITLPAAMGLVIAIIGCMLCWQMECSYERRKSKI